ncbi:Crp/Fnr family transcriptional regulator [Palleronia abyssalis]|uniref:Nitrogen fixation regulation protein FixK n=1 Tax=Palleronia abyssalis TaxID=1501240 RepID=A0A2R8BYZ1_9RHOB|nr:Crp/Fnr family transcriptional regulator [Palleronia abyssalis]SPJ25387.1 Nitrogen fixation regulation protein FixK [Palleronia abyssalis]
MTESCLARRLGNFLDLSDNERAFIESMENTPRQMKKGEVLVSKGAKTNKLYVVKWGWSIVSAREVTGRRAILRTYLPGEVIGLAEIGSPVAPHDIFMSTDGAVCPFPRASLGRIYEQAPRLAALLTAISSAEQVILRELLLAVGRMPAEDRLILFLLTLLDRLSVAGAETSSRFHVPLSQSEIGDALCLTSVYVSRLFTKLRREGQIELEDRHIRLQDRAGLEERVGYAPLATRIDTSWFSKARVRPD